MSKMKVLVLMHESLVPPDKYKNKEEWESADWKTEYDVLNCLRYLGHNVMALGVGSDIKPIKQALDEFKPRIVFNLMEEFAGEAIFDQNVVSYLEMKGVKYSGCNPPGLMIARNKALAKKIMAYHRIPTPQFYVFKKRKNVKIPSKIKYPLFVKTLTEEASLGITQDSIVSDEKQLRERLSYFFEKFETDVIAESYIEGREFYVGILGNDKLQVFPVWELFFKKVSERVPKIATSKVKWDFKYRKKFGITTGPAKNLSPELIKKIHTVCRRTYKALELSGYARIDLRLDANNEIYVIEANPNPDIGYHEDLADSAEAAGVKYPDLLTKILNLGLGS